MAHCRRSDGIAEALGGRSHMVSHLGFQKPATAPLRYVLDAVSTLRILIRSRPDAVLEPYQKAERANKGITGKATTTLMQKTGSAMLTFSGETASGVKIDGEVNCRKVDAA